MSEDSIIKIDKKIAEVFGMHEGTASRFRRSKDKRFKLRYEAYVQYLTNKEKNENRNDGRSN